MPALPEPLQTPLLADELPDAAQLAAQAGLRARDGHWDELQGRLSAPDQTGAAMAPLWQAFWQAGGLGTWQQLDARAARMSRRVQEDGASYNVYANPDGEGPSASHVWPLELLPLLIDASEWQQIEAGVRQRAKLLNATLVDLYGERRLLARGLLPASLVLAHPQYLRPLQGCQPPGCVFLHVAAFDLARGPDGLWWLVAQRTQAPSGLGYMLENRLIAAEAFPEAFRELGIQRLAGAFRTLLQGLSKLAPVAPGESCRVALLTPGPHNETYFEHAFLARYLGISLVEGGDLTVRDNRVYLKTLRGLERLHVLLRRVDDEYLDPLELRADSQLGIPGLVQALRAKQVLLANAPGAGWLESPGLAAFWPGVAEALLGEELLLPAGDSWWCGEASAWADCRERLADFVVAPTFPSSETTRGFAPFLASDLDAAALIALQARIDADPTAHTLKERLRPSMQPVWRAGLLEPRAAVLRVFAVCDGEGGWTVLPGGLTRVAPSLGSSGAAPDALLSMQTGCASIDSWVQAQGPVDRSSLLPPPLQAADLARAHRTVTSRAAENLFWLGRYTERCENSLRLARLSLASLAAGAPGESLLQMLIAAGRRQGLLPLETGDVPLTPRELEAQLLQRLGDAQAAGSLGWNLQALAGCAQALRERLSTPHWQLIQQIGNDFADGLVRVQAQQQDIASLLAATDQQLAALTGAQLDRMTRDDGWRLLSVGRQIERLHALAELLLQGLNLDLPQSDEGFALLLALFDSTITYRAQFQDRRELAPLLQLLVMDRDNPRALAWVAGTLRERFLKLARHDPEWAAQRALALPDPERWSLAPLLRCDAAGRQLALQELLQQCSAQSLQLSTEISRHLFAHVAASERRVWQ